MFLVSCCVAIVLVFRQKWQFNKDTDMCFLLKGNLFVLY